MFKFCAFGILICFLIEASSASELVCEHYEQVFNRLTGSEYYVSSHETCILANVPLTELESASLAFEDVKMVLIRDSDLKELPKKGFSMEQLSVYRITNTSLSVIKSGDFEEAALLKLLYLSHNQLNRIDSDAFKGALLLRELDLSHNQITDLDDVAFRGLEQLKALDLSGNLLKRFNSDLIANMEFLQILRLTKNQLEGDISLKWSKFASDPQLNFDDNKIMKFSIDFNTEWHYVTFVLTLRNNALSDFTLSLKSYFDISLDLSLNDLKELPDLNFVDQLRKIDLSFNPLSLESFERFVKYDVPNLTFLNLTGTGFPSNLVQNLTEFKELQTLDLSRNNYTEIDLIFISKLKSLHDLSLKDNLLTYLDIERLVKVMPHSVEPIVHPVYISPPGAYPSPVPVPRNPSVRWEKNRFSRLTTFGKPAHQFYPRRIQLDLDGNRFNCSVLNQLYDRFKSINIDLKTNSYPKHYYFVHGISCLHDQLIKCSKFLKDRSLSQFISALSDNIRTCYFTNVGVHKETTVTYEGFNDPIEALMIDGSVIEQIPTPNVEKLKILSITTSRVSSLEELELSLAKSLEMFEISGASFWNKTFKVLKSGTFNGADKLKILILSIENLEIVEENAFEGLNKLEKLDLSKSPIHTIEPNTLLPLKSLRHFYLRHTLLRDSFELFWYGSDTLDIDTSFSPISSLKINQKGEIPIKTLYVEAEANALSRIEVLPPLSTDAAAHVNIISNNFTKLSTINFLENLVTLHACLNPFDFDYEDLFLLLLPRLQKLTLNNGGFDEWDLSSLKMLRTLTTLDLASNNLESFDLSLLNSLKDLRWLSLNNNQLSHFEPKYLLKRGENLTLLVDANDFKCKDLRTFKRELKKKNVFVFGTQCRNYVTLRDVLNAIESAIEELKQ